MQIYADVLNKDLYVSKNAETCALGGAIAAAVNANLSGFEQAEDRMTNVMDAYYRPIPENVAVYERLYALYRQLHDGFGTPVSSNLFGVMKELLAIKEQQSA